MTIRSVPVCNTYAWIQRSTSYFFLTTGNNNSPLHLYRSQFEDEFGCVGWRDIPRPNFSGFIYHFLPLIDDNNKQCQNILNLEKCWPTKTNMSSDYYHYCWHVCCQFLLYIFKFNKNRCNYNSIMQC